MPDQGFGDASKPLFAALLDYARDKEEKTAAERLVKVALQREEDQSQAATRVYKKMLGNIEIHITEVSVS